MKGRNGKAIVSVRRLLEVGGFKDGVKAVTGLSARYVKKRHVPEVLDVFVEARRDERVGELGDVITQNYIHG